MRYILIILIILSFTDITYTQSGSPEVKQINERLYNISGLGGNVGFLITNSGVVVVDAGNSPADGKTIIQKVKEITEQPIKYLIITHYHNDHTNGMQAFDEGIKIVGHRNLISNLNERKVARLKESIEQNIPANIEQLEKKIAVLKAKNDTSFLQEEINLQRAKQRLEDTKQIRIIEPNIVFEDNHTLILDKDTIEVIYPQPAHTKCNAVVLFKSQKVLHTGDILFNGSFPFIVWQDGIDTKNWADFLIKVAETWQVDKIIPGHGQLAEKKDLLRLSNYLSDLRAAVSAEIKAGKSLDEMKKTISFDKYRDFKSAQLIPMNIESVYNELRTK